MKRRPAARRRARAARRRRRPGPPRHAGASLAIRLASESKPALAMQANRRPSTDPRSIAGVRRRRSPRTRRRGSRGSRAHERSRCPARREGRRARLPGCSRQLGRDRPDRPSPPSAIAVAPSAAASRASSRAWARSRVSGRLLHPKPGQSPLDRGEDLPGPAATGRRVDDQAGGWHGSRVLRSSLRQPGRRSRHRVGR